MELEWGDGSGNVGMYWNEGMLVGVCGWGREEGCGCGCTWLGRL